MASYKKYHGKWFMTDKMDPFFIYKIAPAGFGTYSNLVMLDEEGYIDKTSWSTYQLTKKLKRLENVSPLNRSCMKGIFKHTGIQKVNF